MLDSIIEYSTCPNGVTLYTEKSQTMNEKKKIETHSIVLFLYSIMTGSKINVGSQSKVRYLNFVVVVSVLLPICCHIGWGMPFLCIFVEEIVMILCANKCANWFMVGIRP